MTVLIVVAVWVLLLGGYLAATWRFHRAYEADVFEGYMEDLASKMKAHVVHLNLDIPDNPFRRTMDQVTEIIGKGLASLDAFAAVMASAGNRVALANSVLIEEARAKAMAVGMSFDAFEAILAESKEEARVSRWSFAAVFERRFREAFTIAIGGPDLLAALREEYVGEKEPIRRLGIAVPPMTPHRPKGLQ